MVMVPRTPKHQRAGSSEPVVSTCFCRQDDRAEARGNPSDGFGATMADDAEGGTGTVLQESSRCQRSCGGR